MATKPTNSVPVWAGAGNYPASVYPLFQPWGDANPLGGMATPWSGQPRLNATGLTSFANAGLTPQVPTPASSFNEWLSRLQEWAAWLELGSDTNDANAHVVESDAFGVVTAVAFESEFSFQGLGATKAPFANGALVPTGMELELAGTAKIASTNAAIVESGRFEFITGGAAPTVRQLTADSNDVLKYNDGTIEQVHVSGQGYVYATGDQLASTGNGAAHFVATTTVALTALGNGNVRVIVEGWGQMQGASAAVSVEGDDGFGAYTIIGTAQTSTWTGIVDPNLWTYFRVERVYTAGVVIARSYRCHVVGNGGLVAVRETNLRVVPERF